VKFILDGMLGKLTRWLRMMGHDSKYSTELSDSELLGIAQKEKSVLLTRDLSLYQLGIAKNAEAYYVEGITESDRLAELSDRFGILIAIDIAHSRCPKCNTQLTSVPKEEIAEKVEPNTLLYYKEFWNCSNCGAVYWQGAHWAKISVTLEEAKLKQKKKV
jgi:uncharacterized protein with PIN domain